jgi:hypothetical protein
MMTESALEFRDGASKEEFGLTRAASFVTRVGEFRPLPVLYYCA